MEFEQIVKRLEWLDDEHRKDKASFSSLNERLTSLERDISTFSKEIKELNAKITGVLPVNARLDQFEEMVSKLRVEVNQSVDDIEKRHQRREKEAEKRYYESLEEIKVSLPKLDQSKEITELRKKIKERADEDIKLNVAVTELKPKLDDAVRKSADVAQSIKLVEDSRRQDIKRVADMQGEITAIRKRVDEFRQKEDLHKDSLRNIENRMLEMVTSENSRKQAQQEFLEKQALAQIDRDRALKEWRESYESFQKQVEGLDMQTQVLDDTLRAAKRAQETYQELNQKLERRINEITEMQRLAEDRLRQEWVTFKADDQKRWTGYTLSQEEAIREMRKTIQNFEGRFPEFDDIAQTLQDQLHQTTDATEQQLQELMNVIHEWLTAYERIMGHTRKAPK